MDELVRGQNHRAQKAGARHDLTLEQWRETLDYFDHKCAYCGVKEFEVIEHYLPVRVAGTTVGNCVPACYNCNALKDAKNHSLRLYQNERVLVFLESKGVRISFHIHEYQAFMDGYVILICNDCGDRIHLPGLEMENASEYIRMFYQNTGYAYIDE